MTFNRTTMTLFLIVLLLAICGAYQAASAQDMPQNEAAHWQFTAAAGFGEIPNHWDISYRVYDSPKWAGWIDGFFTFADDTFGGGVSAQYKPVELPMVDAVGAGALYTGHDWKPTVYVKKTIAEF